MTVKELRERLAAFTDEDAQVVVGVDPREWVKPLVTMDAIVDLGRVKERVFFIMCPELPAEEPDSDDCQECENLRDAIDKARAALDEA